MTAAVFADGDAQVMVAIVSLVGVLAALWAQNRKTHRENRSDHADTSAKVDQLLEAQGDIAADVREVKAEVRFHGERLRVLEAAAKPKPAPRKKAV
jgi:uncharacterized protein YlxW (UPF0749 family)